MTETKAKAMARQWRVYHGPLQGYHDEELDGLVAALILSVDARARENAALLCDELQEDMADADKCAAAIRAGETA